MDSRASKYVCFIGHFLIVVVMLWFLHQISPIFRIGLKFDENNSHQKAPLLHMLAKPQGINVYKIIWIRACVHKLERNFHGNFWPFLPAFWKQHIFPSKMELQPIVIYLPISNDARTSPLPSHCIGICTDISLGLKINEMSFPITWDGQQFIFFFDKEVG